MRYPFSFALAVFSLFIAFSPARTPAGTKEVSKEVALEQIDKGEIDEAMKTLHRLRKKQPSEPAGYGIAAQVLLQQGNVEKAKSVLERGIRKSDNPAPLHFIFAKQLLTEARDGPGIVRSGNGVRFQPSEGVDETAYREERLKEAVDHLREAVKSPYFDLEAQPALVFALGELGEYEEALATAYEAMTDEQVDPQVICGAMNALNHLGRSEEALTVGTEGIETFDRYSPLWYLLSQTYEKLGNETEAATSRIKAEYYEFLPEFIDLEYSAKNWEIISQLFGQTSSATETNGLFGPKMDFRAIEATIDVLASAPSGSDANKMLAALCHSHMAHGRLEDLAYEELSNDGEEQLLLDIFNHAESNCTIGGSLRALAMMNSQQCFPLLVEQLPNDSGFFSMRIAESMAILGDERAIPYLSRRLDTVMQPDPQGKSRDVEDLLNTLVDDGSLFVALAQFGTAPAVETISRYRDRGESRCWMGCAVAEVQSPGGWRRYDSAG